MFSGFVRKKIESASSLGERLKRARLEANVSLDDLASVTKIPKSYLMFLEEGQYDQLPADVYVRGYLKAYIRCLGLDDHEMLELYKRERGIQENVKKSKTKIKKSKINFIITPKMIKIAGIVLLVLGLFFYLWIQLHTLAAPPKLEITNPVSDLTINQDTIKIKGKTEPEVELFINDQQVSLDSQGNFEETIGLTKGMNTLNIKAKSKVGKETSVLRKILVEAAQEVAGEQDIKALTSSSDTGKCTEELELTITVKDDPTWLHILEDDKVVFSGVAPVNFSQTFRAQEKITISTGKAHTTFVEFCGKDLGSLGQKGEVIKDKEFTKEMAG